MTPCPDRESLLQALVDGELDAANAFTVEGHLRTCAGCSEHYAMLQALRARLGETGLGHKAPQSLRNAIDRMVVEETRALSRRAPAWWARPLPAWSAAGAMTAIAAGLALVLVSAPRSSFEDQLVADHIRALQGDHLIDVATSNRHVVRPWFNGKVDFAPPVPDLAAEGFPLVGGRLDYAGGRTVAAIVYRRHAHTINLFVMPKAGGTPPLARRRKDSYGTIHWREKDLDFWAVSDVEGQDLADFRQAFKAASLAEPPAAP